MVQLRDPTCVVIGGNQTWFANWRPQREWRVGRDEAPSRVCRAADNGGAPARLPAALVRPVRGIHVITPGEQRAEESDLGLRRGAAIDRGAADQRRRILEERRSPRGGRVRAIGLVCIGIGKPEQQPKPSVLGTQALNLALELGRRRLLLVLRRAPRVLAHRGSPARRNSAARSVYRACAQWRSPNRQAASRVSISPAGSPTRP